MMYAKPPAKLCPGCGRYWMRVKGVRDTAEHSKNDIYVSTKLVYYCPICETIADLPLDYNPMNFDKRCQL